MSAKQASNATSANRVQGFVGNVVNGFEIIKLSGKQSHSTTDQLTFISYIKEIKFVTFLFNSLLCLHYRSGQVLLCL